jgi:hypothetical protein
MSFTRFPICSLGFQCVWTWGLDSWCKQICHLGCEVCNNGALLSRWQSGTAKEASRVVWTGGWVVAVQRKRETRRTRRQRRGSARVCLSVHTSETKRDCLLLLLLRLAIVAELPFCNPCPVWRYRWRLWRGTTSIWMSAPRILYVAPSF